MVFYEQKKVKPAIKVVTITNQTSIKTKIFTIKEL
jgi:hypothetical protein